VDIIREKSLRGYLEVIERKILTLNDKGKRRRGSAFTLTRMMKINV